MSTMMLDKPLHGARAWTAATVDEPASWYCALDAGCLAELDALGVQDEPRGADGLVTDIRIDGRLPACARCLQPAMDALAQGRGFIIIDRPSACWTPQQQIAAYWMLGQVLDRHSSRMWPAPCCSTSMTPGAP